MRVLDKKIQKVLSMKTTQGDIKEALDSFAEYYDTKDNSADCRKNLKYSLEGISCEYVKKFATELGKFYTVFEKFSADLNEVTSVCSSIEACIDETEKETRTLNSFHNDTLVYEQRLRSRKHALEQFLHDYTLSQEERTILESQPIYEEGSNEFFTILDRVKQIKERCTTLMKDPYCMMTATLELLETVSADEENAYHRLFSWCQTQCHYTGEKNYCLDEGNLSFIYLRNGLNQLRVKDSYYNHCITEFVNNRRNLLTLLLADNLSQWKSRSTDENSNQIISDMFTWIHEYMNEEKCGIKALILSSGEESDSTISSSDSALVKSCLDVIFSGANKYIQEYLIPLFKDTSNLPALFEMLQILAFYNNTVVTLISETSSLASTIDSMEHSLWLRITHLLTVKVKHYFKLSPFVSNSFIPIERSENSKNDLAGNTIFTELLLLLKQCFDILNNTTMTMTNKTELFDSLVEVALKPLTENSHDYFQIMDNMDMYIALVNVIEELKSVVNIYGFGIHYNYYLCEKSDYYTDVIIKDKLNALFKDCDLLRLLQQMDSLSHPLSIHTIASPVIIEKGTQLLVSKMYLFINNEFYFIHPKLRTRVKLAASRMICEKYEKLYNAIHDPDNGYINIDSLMIHTPQQIKTLLDCD